MNRRSFNRYMAATGFAAPFINALPANANLDGRDRILRSGVLRYVDVQVSGSVERVTQILVGDANINIRNIPSGSQLISLNSRYRSYQVEDDGVDQQSIQSNVAERMEGFSEGGNVRQYGTTLIFEPRVTLSGRITLDLVVDRLGYYDIDVNSRQTRSDVQLPFMLNRIPAIGRFWYKQNRRRRTEISVFITPSIVHPSEL